jgi:hypothetical protein
MLLKLLALPVTAPVAGIRFCLDKVLEAAEQEWLDEAPVKEALLLLTLKLEEGEIGEEDYAEEEAALLKRLREIRAYKQGRDPAADATRPAVVSMQEGRVVLDISTSLDHFGPEADQAGHG